MGKKKTYLLVLVSLLGIWVTAQDHEYKGNPDLSLYNAQELAFKGKRDIARDTLKLILTKYPNYNDVRNLLASTYSWDGKYVEARKHFNKITSADKKNKDTWVAAIKNEIYAKEYYIALGLANKAIFYNADDVQLLKLRDDILKKIPEYAEKGPELPNTGSKKFFYEDKVYKNRIAISNTADIFDVFYDPMLYSSLEYKRTTKIGSFIPRINYSNRFRTNGIQFEFDAYPKFSEKFYAYANYAFSNSPIYPNHRAGAELYSNLPKNLEVSLGMRYMSFSDTKVNIFTGSLGLYSGNYYFSLRPYITPSEGKPVGISGQILGRKYFKDAENYIGFMAGYGFSPELKQLRDGNELLAQTLLYVESQNILFEYQFSGRKQYNLYKANLGVVRQELVFDSGNFYWALSAGFKYHIKF